MNKNKIRFPLVISAIMLCIIMFIFLGYLCHGQMGLKNDRQLSSDDVIELDTGWEIITDAGTESDIVLPTELNDRAESFILRYTLHNSCENAYLLFWNTGHSVTAYVDGTKRFQTETEGTQLFGSNIPYHYDFIPLTDAEPNSIVELYFSDFGEENNTIGSAFLGTQANLLVYILNKNQLGIILAVLVGFVGLIVCIISCVLRFRSVALTKMIYLSTCICLIAIWYLCNSPASQFLFPNSPTARDCAFFAVSALPMPMLLYINNIQRSRQEKYFAAPLILVFLNFCFTVFTYMLTGISLNTLFLSTVLTVLFSSVMVSWTIIRDFFHHHVREYRLNAVGILAFLVSACTYLILYSLFPFQGNSGMAILLGLMIWLILAIISIIQEIQQVYRQKMAAEASVRSISRQAMESLARSVDAKDHYTHGHSDRVADYSYRISLRAGKNEEEAQNIYYIALLHDIGKIGVPDTIINKTGKLTDTEFDIIKSHPVIGSDILEDMRDLPDLYIGARWHHERYDGKGYPDGLSGEDIPEIARIVAVADSYDAMTSKRSYRGILPQEKVRSEIEKGKGTQFDPRFADIMLQMIDEDTEYIMHES